MKHNTRQAHPHAVDVQMAILNALPAHIALLDRDGVILAVNDAWRHYASAASVLGDDSFIGQNYLKICDHAVGECADEAKAAADGIRCVLNGAAADFSLEYPCHSPTKEQWFCLTVTPLEHDAISGAVVMHVDVTDRKLSETALEEKTRALQLLSRCNEALIRCESEMELLTKICQAAVEVGGFTLAWVGFAQQDAMKSVVPMAIAGNEHGYLSDAVISWAPDTPQGRGPVGKAIREGHMVVVPDLAADADFKPWLEAAQARGFHGVIALPLKDATQHLGVLTLYMREVRHPQPDELRVLQELADDLTFGIVNLRDRAARRQMQAAVLSVATAVSAVAGKPFFGQLAEGMASALGAHAGFVAQFLPGEPLTARTIAAVVEGKPAEHFDYIIEGTPCEHLITEETCVIQYGVADQFPRSPALAKLGAQSYVGRRLDSSTGKFLGLLFVLFREPLREPDLVVAMLQIFAARAASELERLETDARVREQAALLDKARDGIFLRDLDHKILYWNKGAERLYGFRAEAVIGRDLRDLIPHDGMALSAAFKKLVATGEVAREIEHVTEDGKAVVIERHCSLVHDEQGNPQSVLSINSDITERKKIEAQYLRAQRMESIGTLAGGIAHDLNNVLAPIMMSIELLKIKERNPERLELLQTIEGSAKRGAEMIRQVLSFARGVEGRRLEICIRALISEIQKIVQDTFQKNIMVQCDVVPDLWSVRGDPTQLHQVLINLCVNARDAMATGGTLRITASNRMLDQHGAGMIIDAQPGPYVSIEVEDSGHGMTPEVIEHIFEPFFTTKDVGQGTGLGLPSTMAIIKGHGGFIRVYSEVGMGSRFQIYLPAKQEPGTAEIHPVAVALPHGNGELVLVVDDEAAVRHVTKQTLEAFGYRVILATDGIEATSIYATRLHEIDIILTDMMMPLMDGLTTIQVMLRLNPKARIIASSGLNANASIAKATGAGVKGFITKPYSAEVLLRTLRESLDAPA